MHTPLQSSRDKNRVRQYRFPSPQKISPTNKRFGLQTTEKKNSLVGFETPYESTSSAVRKSGYHDYQLHHRGRVRQPTVDVVVFWRRDNLWRREKRVRAAPCTVVSTRGLIARWTVYPIQSPPRDFRVYVHKGLLLPVLVSCVLSPPPHTGGLHSTAHPTPPGSTLPKQTTDQTTEH